MQYHQVQVDNDVFEYVKKNAEPLVDDFNSALKKLLQIDKTKKIKRPSLDKEIFNEYSNKAIPAGTPQALVQILKVAKLVLQGNSRYQATHIVAKEHKVTPQTVIDKYTRQLGIPASKFDWLLAQPEHNELRSLLKSIYHNFTYVIEDVLF